jgi:hypothetical protein
MITRAARTGAATAPSDLDTALAQIAELKVAVELLQMQVTVLRLDTNRDLEGLGAAVTECIRRTAR